MTEEADNWFNAQDSPRGKVDENSIPRKVRISVIAFIIVLDRGIVPQGFVSRLSAYPQGLDLIFFYLGLPSQSVLIEFEGDCNKTLLVWNQSLDFCTQFRRELAKERKVCWSTDDSYTRFD